MQVFHGSYTEIESVDLSKSQSNKDFGKGFSKLSDTATKFYEKDWTQIYELLLSELKL